MKKISFVIPCYRSEHTLPHVIAEIEEKIRQHSQDIGMVVEVQDDDEDEPVNELFFDEE